MHDHIRKNEWAEFFQMLLLWLFSGGGIVVPVLLAYALGLLPKHQASAAQALPALPLVSIR